MTTLLSFLCSEPLLSSCHPRRNTYTSENEYLIDSESWDLPATSKKSNSDAFINSINQEQHQNLNTTRRPPRLQRLISFVSALNPLKLSREEDDQLDYGPQKRKLSNSQTVSFAAIPNTPSSACNPAMLNDDDYEIRHFAIVEITPGGKPLFISDARRCDRNKLWFSRNSAQSFDVALRRRRSLSSARMNRRAFSLNKMAELDASARRATYSRQRVRPESEFIDAKTYNGRPVFYAFDEDENVDSSDLHALEWNHPARNALFESYFCEATTPPRPPKSRNYRDNSPNSRTYINEAKAPPRPPKN